MADNEFQPVAVPAEGMTSRAIAPVVGVGHVTVARDLAVPVSDETPAHVDRDTGEINAPAAPGLLDALDRLPALSPWAASVVVLGLRAAAGDNYVVPAYRSEGFDALDGDDPRRLAAAVLAAERSEAAVVAEAVARIRDVSLDISTAPEWSSFSRWSQRERAARAARVAAGLEREAV